MSGISRIFNLYKSANVNLCDLKNATYAHEATHTCIASSKKNKVI